jgi:serine/threonine protein kinase
MSKLINTYLGQFLLTELLYPGDLFTIYKAYQPALDRYVAIKVLSPSPSPDDLERASHFKLAAVEIAKVHHPNILRIYDYNEQDGTRYLVLQYIEGGATLADICGKALEQSMVVHLATQLLDALDYAHQRGVIHGDIKPANILITASGWPVLSDFGIVKRMNDSRRLMLSGQVIGTPTYMAPEVIAGGASDVRTDLYSFGVVLYELLTGRVPFDADTPMAVLEKHIHEPPPPRRFNAELTPALEAVVLRALNKDPAARYETAAEMVAELARVQVTLSSRQSSLIAPSAPSTEKKLTGSTERTTAQLLEAAAFEIPVVETNKALIRRWIEDVWNHGNLAIIDELLASNASAAAQAINKWRMVFPGISFTIEEMIAEDDKVVVRWSGQGIHLGMTLLSLPTDKTVRIMGMSIYRIVDGKIVESWNHWPHYPVGT